MPAYDSWTSAVRTLFSASLGTFSYDDLEGLDERARVYAQLLLSTYLVLAAILLTNLLIAIISYKYRPEVREGGREGGVEERGGRGGAGSGGREGEGAEWSGVERSGEEWRDHGNPIGPRRVWREQKVGAQHSALVGGVPSHPPKAHGLSCSLGSGTQIPTAWPLPRSPAHPHVSGPAGGAGGECIRLGGDGGQVPLPGEGGGEGARASWERA